MGPKVMPQVEMDFGVWETKVTGMLQLLESAPAGEALPDAVFRASKPSRCVAKFVTLPCCCSPCVLWSAGWRLGCMPCSVFTGGCERICSNNGCTKCSDECVATAYKGVDAKAVVPALGRPYESLAQEQIRRVLAIMQRTRTLLNAPDIDLKRRYVMAAVLGPALVASDTPFGVINALDKFEARMSSHQKLLQSNV